MDPTITVFPFNAISEISFELDSDSFWQIESQMPHSSQSVCSTTSSWANCVCVYFSFNSLFICVFLFETLTYISHSHPLSAAGAFATLRIFEVYLPMLICYSPPSVLCTIWWIHETTHSILPVGLLGASEDACNSRKWVRSAWRNMRAQRDY